MANVFTIHQNDGTGAHAVTGTLDTGSDSRGCILTSATVNNATTHTGQYFSAFGGTTALIPWGHIRKIT